MARQLPKSDYNLRSTSNRYQFLSDRSTLPPQDGYQRPSQQSDFDQRLAGVTETLESISPMIDCLKPESQFETGIVNIVRLLTGQLKELKLDHNRFRNEMYCSMRSSNEHMDELMLSSVKNEQYSRRDTINVVGLSKPESESQSELCTKVADALSQSGESIKASDLSAVHRNSKDAKND